jgi:hypothetical protein
MRKRSHFATLILIVIGCAALAVAASRRLQIGSTDQLDSLRIDPVSQELGLVPFQQEVEHDLRLLNTSSRHVDISGFQLSCSCIRVTPESLSIAPNSHSTVRLAIEYELDRLKRVNRHDPIPISIKVVPLNKYGRPLSRPWDIKGSLQSWVTLSATSLTFGEVPLPYNRQAGHAYHDITMRLEVDHKITAILPHSENPHLTVRSIDISTDSKDDGRTIDLHCRLTTPERHGVFNSYILIRAAHGDGSQLPPLRVPVYARVVSNVDTSPSTVILDDAQPVRLMLSSRGDEPMVVSKVSVADPAIVVRESTSDTAFKAVYEVSATRSIALSHITFTVAFPNYANHLEDIRVSVASPGMSSLRTNAQKRSLE